ncbi:MATH/TRAF domain-containing protein [Hirschfeldia incana]|nr:MATH/TRAF domain-containing protein [Hirschfeldia incana]
MEDHKPTSFTFEIDNFLEKEAVVSSPTFSSGGCQWYANVYPKGNGIEGHLALYLSVANSISLQLGWKRRAKYSFVLLNQYGKEIHKTTEFCQVFCAQVSGWSFPRALTLEKLQEKGFLENNKLIVKVQVQVVEVVNEAHVTGNETMDIEGFQVLCSQAIQVSWIFVRHPDIALNFKPKSHSVKTTYMNLLLKLVEKLDKPPQSFSETELSNTRTELVDLTETGFKLDWLKVKLDEITLERKKTADASRIQELEQDNKNLKAELNKEKIKSAASAAKVLWLEQTVSTLKTKQNKKPKLSPN